MNDIAELIFDVLKHLPGQHDQDKHGGIDSFPSMTQPTVTYSKEDILTALDRMPFKDKKLSVYIGGFFRRRDIGESVGFYLYINDKYTDKFGYESDVSGRDSAFGSGPHDSIPSIWIPKKFRTQLNNTWPRTSKDDLRRAVSSKKIKEIIQNLEG
jgi:hypothetical protein